MEKLTLQEQVASDYLFIIQWGVFFSDFVIGGLLVCH